MSFNTKVILFDSIALIISLLYIYYSFQMADKKNRKYVENLVESDIRKSCEIRKLNREIDRLNNIIKNNSYDNKLDYKSINYITDDNYRLDKIDGVIYIAFGYTKDITKAKNFIKDGNQYYEVKRKEN